MTRWSFDDNYIGRIDKTGSLLATKDIPRPPRITNEEWYSHAAAVIRELNARGVS